MSNLLVSPKWNSFINKVDAGEEITGGDSGNANIATRQLAENVVFLRDSMFTLVADATGDLSQAIEESNKKTKDEFDIVAGLIAAQNEIIIAEAKARKEAISASNDKIAAEAAERVRELGLQSTALQEEIDARKEAFRLEHISRAESEAAFTEALEEVLSEAEASVSKVENLSTRLVGGYDGSNLDFVTEGLLFQQKNATSTALEGMAEQISMLSVGVGEQFDTAKIWHFDKNKENWINGVFDIGYLLVKSETVTSPTFLIDGDVYHHIKMRINKVGDPDWGGNLVWNSGSIALPEPVFVDGVTSITLDTTWSGDITQLQLKLSTNADDTNYYKIDWITIGRPSPGASTASLLDLKIATATRDEALAQDIRGLSSKIDTDNALLSSNINTKLETITTQQQTQATDITTLSSNVDTMNTKLSADIVEVNSTLVTKETALAESIAALTSKTNESEASVLTQLQTLTDVDSALGTQLDALTASFDTAQAEITAQNLVFAAEDLAQATQISQLVTKVDNNIAEVNTQIETLTDAESANANKFTSITAEFQALNDKTDASDAEIRVNAADIIEERNARATDILAQATRIDVLTTEVGENAASATSRINLLSLEDQALAERLDVLTAATDNTNANINLRLTALADEDSAFSEQLTQVMSAVDDNSSAVNERVTALTTATDAEAVKLSALTAEVGANSAEIESTSRTVATNVGAIAEFNTRLTVEYLPKVENIESNILNAVKQTDVQYYLSISESQPLGGEWLTTAPTWEPSKYMFQRMETTYVDGTIKHTPGINGTNISGAKGDKGLDGKDGSDGVAGLQGPSGADGIQGPAGKDGESSYTHLAYATSSTGTGFSTGYFETATYIGMYVDNIKEDSENYALYNWSLIKGADGTNGIPGPKGTDGKTSYLHIAYANSPDGAEGFSTTASIGKTYIGQYTDFQLADSTNYALYSWTLIKGEKGDQGPIGLTGLEGPKGDQGIQGPMGPMGPRGPEGLRGLPGLEGLQGDQGIRGEKGEDGLSSYTHIAYATSATGANFNTGHFDAATYIGMYVDTDNTDSTDPSTYKWSLIKGADGANGIPGPKGTDGKTSYLHIAYANNVTGNIGFSTTVSEGKTHIGQYTDFELADSSDYTKYSWTLIKGDKGDTGPIGLQGVPGIEGPKGATGIQGPKGIDGTSSYTHLAYATSATGTNFNTAWYPTATYIGMYVDRTEADSIVPSKYNWSLIKGADGANGIAGPKGADGKTTYLHIAYANSEAGDVGFSTTVSAGKSYIGQYTDTTLGDSEDYSIYSWSLIKGADGLSSYAHLAYATSATGTNFNTNHFQGATYIGMYVDNEEDDSTNYTKYNWSLIKGADGANGIPGPTGADGKTSYLHVAYATSATGAVGFSTTVSAGKTYIGQYTDFELADSPSYTKYKWSLIKGDKGDKGDQGIQGPIGLTGLEGPKGDQGIQGPKGANGLNSYTHIAYATSPDGLDFSTGHFAGATYIGMYVDNTAADSTVYTKYNWSLIKGADGDKGIAGPTGADGKTAYLHIAYATSANGSTGFSTTVSAGKTYIGQYTDNEIVDSPTYTRYKWTLIKGDKGDQGIQGIQGPAGQRGLTGLEGPAGATGIQGPKGADGTSSYTHLAYATSAAGALFSTSWFAAATYIGMYVDNIATDSTVPSKYNWSLIKGADGANGIAGPKGTDGKTAYLHIAYATSANGSVGFSTTISDGKTYIGQYTDNELVDSQTYTKYKWSLIKGDKGDTGPQGPIGLTGVRGLEGPKGDQGIQGADAYTNMVRTQDVWTVGTAGNQGKFSINGPVAANEIVTDIGPSLAPEVLWKSTGHHTSAAGGWNYYGIPIDVSKSYRFSVWVKNLPGASHTTYLGCASCLNLNGTANSNPYFWTGKLPSDDKWYVIIGVLHGADKVDGISSDIAGVYDPATGERVRTASEFKHNSNTSVQTHRAYRYYAGNDIGCFFTRPRMEEINGEELNLGALFGRVPVDGKSSYTHIAYATSATGTNFNTAHFEAATYIGMYVDNTEADSTFPAKYNWSLIKGADGANGIAGPTGADGKTAYLHIAYATSANGATGFSTTVSAGKTYIGQYTDNTLTDSQTYTKYKWTLIKGETGATGPTGNTGATGAVGQGVDTITEQYAVSTSKTVVPTTWTTVMPEWSYGLYVWSRSMIKYKNPVATEYTTPIVDSSWEAVNNINIGGRNLLRNSRYIGFEGSDSGNAGTNTVIGGEYLEIVPKVSGNIYNTAFKLTDSIFAGEEFVVSFYIKTATILNLYFRIGGIADSAIRTVALPNVWQRVEYNAKMVGTRAKDTSFLVGFSNLVLGNTVQVKNWKVEKGNKATDWTPAPEDNEIAISATLDIANKITNDFGILKAETKVLTEIGGKISGWKNLNNGATSSFEILADKFSVSTSTVNIKPFSIVGNDITFNGKVSFNSVTGSISSAQIPAGTINLNQLTTADKNFINTASSTAATALSNAGTAQNRANQAFTQAGTAETNAKSYADLKDKIIVIDSKTKKFLNPSSYSSAASAHTGYLIIETPIQSGRMVTIDITGYNYQANKASIALSVSFYITGTSFHNFDYADTGTYPIENVRLGIKDAKVVIIIGNATSTWSYPKIDVTQAIIGYTAPPDTYKDGWVTRIANVITDITNVRDMSNIYSTSLKGIQNNVYYPNTTEIHGGNIRTKTIAADSIVANSITAGQIAANAITATQIAANTITAAKMTTDSITARELKAGTVAAVHIVGNTITGDKLTINSITAREIKAGSITGDKIVANAEISAPKITGGNIKIGSTTNPVYPTYTDEWATTQGAYRGTMFKVNDGTIAGAPAGFRLLSRDSTGGIELSSFSKSLTVWEGDRIRAQLGKIL